MERVIEYFNEKLPGFDGQIVNVSADGKSFYELASDIYDDMLKNDYFKKGFCKSADIFQYKDRTKADNKYKGTIIDATSLFVKYYIGIIYSVLDENATLLISEFYGKVLKKFAPEKSSVAKKIRKVCSYSDDLAITISPDSYLNENYNKTKTPLKLSKEYKYLIKSLWEEREDSDLLNAEYNKEKSIIVIKKIFEKLINSNDDPDDGEDCKLQLYFINRYFHYPMLNILKDSVSEFENDEKMYFFIKAFHQFGFQEIFQLGFKKVQKLIRQRIMYNRCIEVKEKYELDEGYAAIIGAPTELNFKNISTVKDYIDTLNAEERRALKGIGSYHDLRRKKQEVDEEINTCFSQMNFAFIFVELLSVKVIRAVIDYVKNLEENSRKQYIGEFYRNINTKVTPVDMKLFREFNRNHIMKILNNKEISNAVCGSIKYFIDMYYYIKSLYKKRSAYRKLRETVKDEQSLRLIKKALDNLEVIKNDVLFELYEDSIKQLVHYYSENMLSSEMLSKYYLPIHELFSKYHHEICESFITIGTAGAEFFKSMDDKLVDEVRVLLCSPIGSEKDVEELGHYFMGFRRLYKFDFQLQDKDTNDYVQRIKSCIKK